MDQSKCVRRRLTDSSNRRLYEKMLPKSMLLLRSEDKENEEIPEQEQQQKQKQPECPVFKRGSRLGLGLTHVKREKFQEDGATTATLTTPQQSGSSQAGIEANPEEVPIQQSPMMQQPNAVQNRMQNIDSNIQQNLGNVNQSNVSVQNTDMVNALQRANVEIHQQTAMVSQQQQQHQQQQQQQHDDEYEMTSDQPNSIIQQQSPPPPPAIENTSQAENLEIIDNGNDGDDNDSDWDDTDDGVVVVPDFSMMTPVQRCRARRSKAKIEADRERDTLNKRKLRALAKSNKK